MGLSNSTQTYLNGIIEQQQDFTINIIFYIVFLAYLLFVLYITNRYRRNFENKDNLLEPIYRLVVRIIIITHGVILFFYPLFALFLKGTFFDLYQIVFIYYGISLILIPLLIWVIVFDFSVKPILDIFRSKRRFGKR